MKFLLAFVALFGHVAIATVIINRLHANAMPYWCLKVIDALWCAWLILTPLVWLAWAGRPDLLATDLWLFFRPLVLIHLVASAIVAVSLLPGWTHRAITKQTTPLQLSNDTQIVDMIAELGRRPAGTTFARMCSYFPGNEIYHLHVNEKKLALPRLPAALEGLSITHLSDIHFTGQLTRDFYHEVVRRANGLDSDLMVLAGDLIDKPKCLDWLGDILGSLHAKQGVYFVLGNHDLRVRNEFAVRDALVRQGLIDLGRRWIEVELRGVPVLLAGNELPWFVPAADMHRAPPFDPIRSPFRILVAHTPDQIFWARSHHFDLMLAGHTHGGQVRLPGIGPILSPSRYGVRYASGTFFEHPTLMHVSRGIAGTRQLRIGAPPELTRLVLVSQAKKEP